VVWKINNKINRITETLGCAAKLFKPSRWQKETHHFSEIIYKAEMNLGLTKIEWNVVSSADCPGQVKYTNLCFECEAQARAQICVVNVCILTVVSTPPAVQQVVEV